MKKINLSITGCLGRMGKQLIKSSKKSRDFKIVSITENKRFNLSSSTSSISIVASRKSYNLETDILSISFITFLILFKEYFLSTRFSIVSVTSTKSFGS